MGSHPSVSVLTRLAAPLVAAGVVLVASTGAIAQTRAPPIPPAELERLVDGAVSDAMAAEHVAGVAVAIVQDDRTVLLKGYGVAGQGAGRAVDPERTLFRIASISKTFTWIALLKEMERGRLRLDAPVNAYLPPELKIPDQGFRRPIRVIDLMSHSAGFEDLKLGRQNAQTPADLTSIDFALAHYRPDRVREPGEVASYSNYGAALAGYIVARLNGEDYETLIEREILHPLGMSRTTFREPYAPRPGLPAPMPPELAAHVATGFVWGASGFRPQAFEYTSSGAPAASASSTAADMARYMRMQLAGGELDGARIYGPAAAEALRTPVLRTPEGVNGWAHGFMIRPLPGGRSGYGHGGSLQSFLSNMVLVPDLGLGVFVTTNTSTGRGLVERLPGLIVRSFYSPSPPILRAPVPIEDGERRYAGTYYSTRRAYSGPEKFFDLITASDRVSLTPDGYMVTRIGGQTQAWVADGAPGRFKAADSDLSLTFNMDGAGRAVSLTGARGTFTLERAGPMLDPTLYKAAAGGVGLLALALWAAAIYPSNGAPRRLAWARASGLAASGLWLVALAAFAVWTLNADDPRLPFTWPGPAVLTASWSAFLAALASLGMLAATPLVWRGEGWGLARRLLHPLAAVAFLAFAVLTAVRGGLSPWAV